MPPVLARLALGLSLAAAACGGSPPADDPRPDLVLVSIDTLRADHLGSYGYPRDTSPFLDSLAERGVRFSAAHAASSWTLPSHASLLTSRYPRDHGADRQRSGLRPDVVTLAEALGAAGYTTAGFVSWIYLSRSYGFDRGFEHFEELVPPEGRRGPSGNTSVPADRVVNAVLEWSKRDPDRPYFLFLHLFDPHADYEPPLAHVRPFDPKVRSVAPGRYASFEPFIRGIHGGGRKMSVNRLLDIVNLYDGELRFVDAELARLFAGLEKQGLLDDALVAVTSDHGEEFGDHDSLEGHGWTLYQEVTRVPLLLRLPGDPGGRVVDVPVRSIDLAPTLLEAAGVPKPEGFAGRSLLPLARGELAEDALEPPVFSETRRFTQRWSLRSGRYKVILTGGPPNNAFGIPVERGFEVYDLVEDPREREDLGPDHPLTAELRQRLLAWARESGEVASGPAVRLSPDDEERLRALGYGDGEAER